MGYSLIYGEFTIDFAPFRAEGQTYGAQWTIQHNDPAKAAWIPISSGDLQVRGTADEMATLAKQQAIQWIESSRLGVYPWPVTVD